MAFSYVLVNSEAERVSIYKALEEENLADFFLYEVENPTAESFLYTTNPTWAVTIGVYDTEKKGKLACVAIVSPMQNKSGLFHFCFTKNYFSYGVEIGKKIMELLKNMGFQSLMGLTPKVYRHVFPLAEKVGFKIKVAELQGMCFFAKKKKYVPAIISTINF